LFNSLQRAASFFPLNQLLLRCIPVRQLVVSIRAARQRIASICSLRTACCFEDGAYLAGSGVGFVIAASFEDALIAYVVEAAQALIPSLIFG
jgi:hypothetical protein